MISLHFCNSREGRSSDHEGMEIVYFDVSTTFFFVVERKNMVGLLLVQFENLY